VNGVPHRPRTAAGKSMTILGLYLAAGLGAAALPFARLAGDWPLFAVAVLLVAAFVVGQQLVWYSWWTQLGGVLTAAAFVFCTGLAAHSSLLSWHGNRVEAIVTDVTTAQGPRSTTYVYPLRDIQGRRIPGHLSEATAEFRVGDEITVVVDRGDWVDPKTIGEVDTARPFWIAAVIGLVLTVAMSVFGGRSQGTGEPPERGPGGIWFFHRPLSRRERHAIRDSDQPF
jgi:hypothetical protein